MNQFIGPPIGGFLAAIGIAIALGGAAAAYVGPPCSSPRCLGRFRPESLEVGRRIDQEVREGLSYLARHPMLRMLALAIAVIAFSNGAFWAVFVLYVVAPGPMGLSEVGFGLLLTGAALGSVAGTVVAPAIELRIGRANILVVALLVLAAQSTVIASSRDPVVVAVALGTGNAIQSTFNVAYISFRQRIVPDRLLGRVVASFRMLSWGTLPAGALLGGFVGERMGLPAVFLLVAALSLCLVPSRLLITDAGMADAESSVGRTGTAGGAQK